MAMAWSLLVGVIGCNEMIELEEGRLRDGDGEDPEPEPEPEPDCDPGAACGAVGDPCDSDAQCSTNNCSGPNGWCSAYCSVSTDCPGNNWCFLTQNNSNACFPGCFSDSDCAAYPGSTCQAGNTVDGIAWNVCSF